MSETDTSRSIREVMDTEVRKMLNDLEEQQPVVERRVCFWVNEVQNPKTYGGYVASRVIESEPGHEPVYLGDHKVAWGETLEEAQDAARRANERFGLTEKDVLEIRLSSMQASGMFKDDAISLDDGRKVRVGKDGWVNVQTEDGVLLYEIQLPDFEHVMDNLEGFTVQAEVPTGLEEDLECE